MGAHDGHAHAGAGDPETGQMQDLASLVLHLHLLGRVAVVFIGTDIGNDVERDLRREGLRFRSASFVQVVQLAGELLQPGLTGTGDRLVGAGHHGLDG